MITPAPMSRRSVLALVPAALATARLARSEDPMPTLRARTLVIVRHAEKTAATDDPVLSERGQVRARRLVELLSGARVTHLYASQFRRTVQTLEPLALRHELDVTSYDARDPAALVTEIGSRDDAEIIVVAGHSNTLPDLVSRFGGVLTGLDERGWLDESEYDRVVIQTLVALDEHAPLRAVQTLDLRVTLD